jgi:hypothetical protein
MCQKRAILVVVLCFVVLGTSSAASANGLLNLPMIEIYTVHGPWPQGTYSTLDITLSGVPSGFDVQNGTYIGWCIEANLADDPADDSAQFLMDSTDPGGFFSPCENYVDIPWDRVNYLLNNKNGDKMDIQLALWAVAETNYDGRQLTPLAQAMYDDAVANGDGFLPQPGQTVVVAVCADGLSGGRDPDGIQDTIIEVLVPPRDFEGCTPGYWKQDHHFDSWEPTGYEPEDDFGDEFGVDDSWDDTFIEALWKKGGKEKALLRHATAALLNAAHPNVSYYYSVDDVIALVQWAYATGKFNDAKDDLEAANEMGCPLN